MTLFIDFDDVLLNTRIFSKDYLRVYPTFGVSLAVAKATYRKIDQEHGAYDSALHLELLKEMFPKLQAIALNNALDRLRRKTHQYVFKESHVFLSRWKSVGARLELVTSANPQAQLVKIEGSGLAHFFDELHLLRSGREKAATIEKRLRGEQERHFFLDDKKGNVESVKANTPNVCVLQVARHKDQERAHSIDAIVKNLKEASHIIQRGTA